MILGLRPAAKALKISHVALLRAEKSGRVKRTADGKFDVDDCRTALERNTNPKKSASAKKQQRVVQSNKQADLNQAVNEAPSDTPVSRQNKNAEEHGRTYNEAVRQREWLRVDKDAIDLARKRGELVGLAEINAFVAGQIIKARDELTRIPGELRDRLALESDPIKIEAILTERIRRALENLAEYRTG